MKEGAEQHYYIICVKEGQNDLYHNTVCSSLVGHNGALSCGCVLARNLVNEFLAIVCGSSSVVGLLLLLLSHPAHFILTLDFLRTHLALSSHGPHRALITLAVSHSRLINRNSFVLWKTLGSGAHSSVVNPPPLLAPGGPCFFLPRGEGRGEFGRGR